MDNPWVRVGEREKVRLSNAAEVYSSLDKYITSAVSFYREDLSHGLNPFQSQTYPFKIGNGTSRWGIRIHVQGKESPRRYRAQ